MKKHFLLLPLFVCSFLNAEPLKIYILAGQSNMEGHARVSTFDHVFQDPDSKELAKLMMNDKGEPRSAERVWISYSGAKNGERVVKEGKLTADFGAPVKGPKIGPEYTFGLTLEQRVTGPILIIKTAWGGRSLSGNFRPPSCRPITAADLNDTEKQVMTSKGDSIDDKLKVVNEKAGVEYQWMVDHVKDVLANIKRVYPDYDPNQGYEIAGFVWFQGFNDLVNKFTYPKREEPDGFKEYTRLLSHFIRDVRKDFNAPNMPFAIGVMGLDGPIDRSTADIQKTRQQNLRDAMAAPAAMPEFKGNVHAVLTEKCWDSQLGALEDRRTLYKDKIQAAERDKKLSEEERAALIEKLKAETLTPEQKKLYDIAISNFGYHYLGSSKIVGNIGIAFADALTSQNKITIVPAADGNIAGPCLRDPNDTEKANK